MVEALASGLEDALLEFRDEVVHHDADRPDDAASALVVREAIDAGLAGNAAVGAAILDPDGAVMLSEQNRMFTPYFRSDFHAEMVLLTAYEEERQATSDLREHTLITSLEPCEMCMIRIINSGVSTMLYVSPDLGKGGVTGPNELAPHWARLAAPQRFGPAECDPRLAEISLAAFEASIGGVIDKLMARRLVDPGA